MHSLPEEGLQGKTERCTRTDPCTVVTESRNNRPGGSKRMIQRPNPIAYRAMHMHPNCYSHSVLPHQLECKKFTALANMPLYCLFLVF